APQAHRHRGATRAAAPARCARTSGAVGAGALRVGRRRAASAQLRHRMNAAAVASDPTGAAPSAAGGRRPAATPLSAFVLHSYDWSESSLIVELFTREVGRVVAAAKGAKRPTSQLRAVLMPFQPVAVQFARSHGEHGEV